MPRSPKADACPLCGKPATSSAKPFCSQGCRDRDLLNWLGDAYRVPAGPAEDEEGTDGLDREA
ncbi:DNA gyrase inhibitor YacG [Sphingosinicella sp. LHD-64]|uniref:DNA gyrase inhibitor YacG n=1 Tax=Sphingosinicella sp. LHD-64 TaxID=3072139 RepID=UPI00280CDA66|nr:DNA gyrase inhibitor YacG [Sphingosinicella sp. LHD-64]MDQ8756496.1 DNA gyrase inhibitor YacG [Sphingosinicella sp. LHD-64]